MQTRVIVAALDDLLSGRLDAQWFEVSGVVRRVVSGPGGLRFDVTQNNRAGRILVLAAGGGCAAEVDYTIRHRGVCCFQFDRARQTLRPNRSVPPGEPIIVKEPDPDLDALPLRSAYSLMQFSAGQTWAHRVRVRGMAIHSRSGEGFLAARRGPRVGLAMECLIRFSPPLLICVIFVLKPSSLLISGGQDGSEPLPGSFS